MKTNTQSNTYRRGKERARKAREKRENIEHSAFLEALKKLGNYLKNK